MPGKTKPWNIVMYVVSSLAAIGGGIEGFILMKEKIHEAVHKEIDEYLQERKGGFRHEIMQELDRQGRFIKKEDLPEVWVRDHVIVNDSIEKFRKNFLPMLIEEKKYHDVGLKVNKLTAKIMYLHTDGEVYRAFQDANTGLYYFINKDEVMEYCK